MTRIVAGRFGGRRLVTPTGSGTRPTAERVREAVFASVSAGRDLRGMRVLDLYAGSGAIGLEAASRGADHVRLVENAPRALRALRTNVEMLGLPGVEVVAAPVERELAAGPSAPYDLVYLDPPYSLAVDACLAGLLASGWLAAGATVVVERATRSGMLAWPEGIEASRERRYGDTTLWYGRRS